MTLNTDYRKQFQSREAAESYDARYAEDNYANILYNIEKYYLGKSVDSMRKTISSIESLDFACGTGRITSVLEPLVDKSIGLDISSDMLERAKINTNLSEFLCGDLTTDDTLCQGPFDLITTFRFVTNAEPELREKALIALRKRMRSFDSRLVFNVHRNFGSYLFFHWAIQKLRRNKEKHKWNYMSRREARQLVTKCGLQVEKMIGFGLLSTYLTKLLPTNTAQRIEYGLSKMPIINWFGSEFIVICRR